MSEPKLVFEQTIEGAMGAAEPSVEVARYDGQCVTHAVQWREER